MHSPFVSSFPSPVSFHRTVSFPGKVLNFHIMLGDRYHLGHINPHAFRHSQASILLQDGDIVTAAKRLGHAKPTTTLNIYGHMMPQTDKEAAARVSAAFLKNTK